MLYSKLKGIREVAVVTVFKLLSQNLVGGPEENDEKLYSRCCNRDSNLTPSGYRASTTLSANPNTHLSETTTFISLLVGSGRGLNQELIKWLIFYSSEACQIALTLNFVFKSSLSFTFLLSKITEYLREIHRYTLSSNNCIEKPVVH